MSLITAVISAATNPAISKPVKKMIGQAVAKIQQSQPVQGPVQQPSVGQTVRDFQSTYKPPQQNLMSSFQSPYSNPKIRQGVIDTGKAIAQDFTAPFTKEKVQQDVSEVKNTLNRGGTALNDFLTRNYEEARKKGLVKTEIDMAKGAYKNVVNTIDEIGTGLDNIFSKGLQTLGFDTQKRIEENVKSRAIQAKRLAPQNTSETLGAFTSNLMAWGGLASLSERTIAKKMFNVASKEALTLPQRAVVSSASDLIPFGVVNAVQESADADFDTKQWFKNTIGQALLGVGFEKIFYKSAPKILQETLGEQKIKTFYTNLKKSVDKMKKQGLTPEEIEVRIQELGSSPQMRELFGQKVLPQKVEENFVTRRPQEAFLGGKKEMTPEALSVRQGANKEVLALPPPSDVLNEVENIFKPKEKTTVKSLATKAVDFKDRVLQNLVSEFKPLKTLQKRVFKAYGKEAPRLDLQREFEQVAGAAGKAEANINHFEREIISPIKDQYDDFNSFLFLNRTLDRLTKNPEVKKVGNWTIDKATVGLRQLADKVGIENYNKFLGVSSKYQAIMNKNLLNQVKSGRMSVELYNKIKSENDFYAPFKVLKELTGEERAVTGISGTKDLTKKITGIHDDDFRLGDILQGSAQQIYKSNVLADSNMKMRELGKLADLDEGGKFIKKVEEGTNPKKGNQIVSYLENGKPTYLEVPSSVAEAVKGLTVNQTSYMMKALSMGKKPLQFGAIVANPGFQVVNLLFADLPRAALISKMGVRNIADVVKFPAQWLYSLYSSVRGNFGKPNAIYDEFLRSGAANSTISRWLNDRPFKANFATRKKFNVLDNVTKFSSALEETAKILGLVRGKELVKKGKMTFPELVTEIRNFSGSPDFFKKGKTGSEMNLLFMFYNARLQGVTADLSRLGSALNPKAKDFGAGLAAWARLGTAIGIPATTLMLYNLKEENYDDYMQIPQSERDSYFMIPRNNEDGTPKYFTNENGDEVREFWRIPKRESMKLMANMVEDGLHGFFKKDPDAGQQMALDFLENISPITISGENITERGESVLSSMNPIFKVPFEWIVGRNFHFHSDTVPMRLKEASPPMQFKKSTPDFYKKLGEITGQSPLKLKQMIEGATGGLVGQFAPDDPAKGRPQWTSYPILKRFVRSEMVGEDEDMLKKLGDYSELQADVRLFFHNSAEELYDEWKKLPPDEANQNLKELKETDPNVFEALVKIGKDDQLGLTYTERQIKALGVENGARASFLWQIYFPSFPTVEEKDAKLQELIDKKVITKDIIEQFKYFQKLEAEGKELPFQEPKT